MSIHGNTLRIQFGERLSSCRNELKLTLQQLADALNASISKKVFTRNTISQHEHGYNNPNLVHLNVYCDFFGISADYLLGRSNLKSLPNLEDVTKAARTAIVTTTTNDLKVIAQRTIDLLGIAEDHLTEIDKRYLSITIHKAVMIIRDEYEQLL